MTLVEGVMYQSSPALVVSTIVVLYQCQVRFIIQTFIDCSMKRYIASYIVQEVVRQH